MNVIAISLDTFNDDDVDDEEDEDEDDDNDMDGWGLIIVSRSRRDQQDSLLDESLSAEKTGRENR